MLRANHGKLLEFGLDKTNPSKLSAFKGGYPRRPQKKYIRKFGEIIPSKAHPKVVETSGLKFLR